jgi:thioredoxin reductase
VQHDCLPVVIIGAGPVGLAAAVHALSRGLTPLVFEAGAAVGAGIRRWGHVRTFSPWRSNVDGAAATLLARYGWSMPDAESCPTGDDLVDRYLQPLAHTKELAGHVRVNSRVVSVARQDHDLMKDGAREDAPFVVRVAGPAGEEDVLARAVIDASGTIDTPGALGASGLAAIGERAAADRIFYGIPDVLGVLRPRYAGRRVLVVGSGHSAMNALLDLACLAEADPATRITWAIRRPAPAHVFSGTHSDQLVERGKLGSAAGRLLDEERIELLTGFRLDRLTATPDGIVASSGGRAAPPVDEIIAVTGFRPDWSILSEVRLDLDPAVHSTRALAPLIDPNIHSCGTVPPHGAEELKHPEKDLFVIGMKSYGRAPTFLMLTGYEQARSVVAAIAGDWEAARRVELVLPETGACSSASTQHAAAAACCGTSGLVASSAHGPGANANSRHAEGGSMTGPTRQADSPTPETAQPCCDSVLLQTCCVADAKPGCCGPEPAPPTCGCGDESSHAVHADPARP